MSTARERILQRIQTALGERTPAGQQTSTPQVNADVVRSYRQRDAAPRDDIITRFIERVTEYKAHVQRVIAETRIETVPLDRV